LRWFSRDTKLKAPFEIPLVCRVVPVHWEGQVPGETRQCADFQLISNAVLVDPSRAMTILVFYRRPTGFSATLCNSV
jgi:hypothetical protein